MSRKATVVFLVWTIFYLGAFELGLRLLLGNGLDSFPFLDAGWLCLLFAITQIVRFGWILQFNLSTRLTGYACGLSWVEMQAVFVSSRYLSPGDQSTKARLFGGTIVALILIAGRVFDFMAVKVALPVGNSSGVIHE